MIPSLFVPNHGWVGFRVEGITNDNADLLGTAISMPHGESSSLTAVWATADGFA